MNKGLIIDCGSCFGADTGYYLDLGYNVISIDASVEACNYIQSKYHRQIQNKKLEVLNILIGEENFEVDFHISKNPVFSSQIKDLASKYGMYGYSVKVESTTLKNIIHKYNTRPYYVKIDIEGNDYIALTSLIDLNNELKPYYISCEVECSLEYEISSEKNTLKNIKVLSELGYDKFKIVDQRTLSFVTINNYKTIKREIYSLQFKEGMSGLLGEDLPTSWVSFNQAVDILFEYKRYFHKKNPDLEFWVDIHAKYGTII